MSRLCVAIVSAVTLFLLTVMADLGSAFGQTCPANIPHVDGVWSTLPYLMPVNPISATLLSNGSVLIVSGSEYDIDNSEYGSYRAAVWDPTGTGESSIAVQDLNYDVFCSGTSVLPDGRPLIVGGTQIGVYATGDNRASIFNPVTNQFPQSESMANGRWYATATSLGDGRISAFSGTDQNNKRNKTVEIYDVADAGVGWSSPLTAPFTPPLFPRMELLPDSLLFFTGQGASQATTHSWFFNPSTGSWTQSVPTTGNRIYGSAVILPLFPPNYTPRIMNFGGGNPATNSSETIDLSTTSPSWSPGPNMSTARIELNAVILPNGKVLVEGGSMNNEIPDTPGKQADLYDPISNTFSSAGTAAYSRLYHSTALLLPDATVMSLGSNPTSGAYEPAIEIYTPAYLYNVDDQVIVGPRPAITSAPPGVLGYSTPFTINYTSSHPISSAVLMRPGSVTHAFNMDQRLVGLCGPSPQPLCGPGGGTLSLTTPPNGNIAPPGYYMLFLLDSVGVPSKAQFIQLSLHPTTSPSDPIILPSSGVTIVAGSSVDFGTTSSAFQYSWVFPGGSPATSTLQNPGSVIFNTPGTYLTSLTAIDALGNTDPNPPTCMVTVLAANPDFVIRVSPSAQPVFPGQSTTFNVTVTPTLGFTGQVTLAVETPSGFPTGVSNGGFNPSQIIGSGTSRLTMKTSAAAVPYAVSLTVTGTSESIEHAASTTLLINLAPPTNLAASATAKMISLSWNASTGASAYHVKRRTLPGEPYVSVGCTASTSFNDQNVVSGSKYFYVVAADYTGGPDAGGESADSSAVSVSAQ
jgi:Domain of unknown function (DUF1929)/PKD domain